MSTPPSSRRHVGAVGSGRGRYSAATAMAAASAAVAPPSNRPVARAPFDTVASSSSPAYGDPGGGQCGGRSSTASFSSYHHCRRRSSGSSPGGPEPTSPWAPTSWAPMVQQLDAASAQHQREGGGGFGGEGREEKRHPVAVGLFAHQWPFQRDGSGGSGWR
ncbi:unnamed protein product [Ectocarpus sp. CCAP 1310/34]|nr:unnamed protein product [Ectocarpus sp. CCAP 1310/34]